MEMGDLQNLIKTNVDLATSFGSAASGVARAASCAVTLCRDAAPPTQSVTLGIRG